MAASFTYYSLSKLRVTAQPMGQRKRRRARKRTERTEKKLRRYVEFRVFRIFSARCGVFREPPFVTLSR